MLPLTDRPRREYGHADARITATSGWFERRPVLAKDPGRLHEPTDANHVVIGAGFTGLACARRLGELFPGDSIILLEADPIGAGNSGRNSGFLLDISFYDDPPRHVHAARTALQRQGLQALRRIVLEHRIDCDWQPWGSLHGAVNEAELEELTRIERRFAAAGEAAETWPGDKMSAVTGGGRFRRGIFHPGTTLVDPVALIRGLTDTLPANIRVFQRSPVVAIDRRGEWLNVSTEEAAVQARRVYLCVNGATPGLGYGRNRQVKVSTFAAMTRPLTTSDGPLAEVQTLGLLPTVSGGATLRKAADNRLLVRQHYCFSPRGSPSEADYRRFVEQARVSMESRWPALRNIELDYVWSGVMSLTRNNAQLFGELRKDLFVTAFCNGAGNTCGTSAGMLLAEFSAGLTSELLDHQLSLPQPAWVPPDWLLRFFVEREIKRSVRSTAGMNST